MGSLTPATDVGMTCLACVSEARVGTGDTNEGIASGCECVVSVPEFKRLGATLCPPFESKS